MMKREVKEGTPHTRAPNLKMNENRFLTLNESRVISDEAKSAFSPYQRQKPQPIQEPFNSEQEFWDEALRHFSSFFNNPGNPEESLLSVLPALPTVAPVVYRPSSPPATSVIDELKAEYPVPTRGPPTQRDCQCNCCTQWRHYFSPPRSEVNAKSVPKLCYCVCCRQWDIFLHYTYNTPVFGYYERDMFYIGGDHASSSSVSSEKKKRKRKTPAKKNKENSGKTPAKKPENKENSGKARRRKSRDTGKDPTVFANKNLMTMTSLMKRDPTLKLNPGFQPQIPYLTPLDT